jgi:hypothetical protein
MAEEALGGCEWEIMPLLVLLDRVDRMINSSVRVDGAP